MTDVAISGRRIGLTDVLSSRVGWSVFAAILILSLVFGSQHPSDTSRAARIASLETVIKCPPCADLSIGQSSAPQAKALRSSVTSWVDQGWSDQRIESRVVAMFGPDELLRPHNLIIWVVPIVALVLGGLVLITVLYRRSQKPSFVAPGEADEQAVREALAKDRVR